VGTAGPRALFHIRQFASGSTAELDTLILDGAGNATFVGTITGTAKNFRITHPLDATKYLSHACLEGPENGVYYRGEAVTKDNFVEITLPSYFEALVREEGRTVLLTPILDDSKKSVGTLAASRVSYGKFTVYSNVPDQAFYWEVKAIRADIDILEVETNKPEDLNGSEARTTN
jgi:hypothetical protein